jgi:hypothetical protein
MDEPLHGTVASPIVKLEWLMPAIGPNAPLDDDEAAELLRRHSVVAYKFVGMFSAILTDPTYLPLFSKLMSSVAYMIRGEIDERNDKAADELRKFLEADDDEL